MAIIYVLGVPMSEEQLKAFLGKVEGDNNLQEKLKRAKSPEEITSIAKDYGYEFSSDKLSQFTDLGDEELEGMAGGYCYNTCDGANITN